MLGFEIAGAVAGNRNSFISWRRVWRAGRLCQGRELRSRRRSRCFASL